MRVSYLLWATAAMLQLPYAPAIAQDADETALEALEQNSPPAPPVKLEPAGAFELRDAVRRIAIRPNDSFALTDAGYAALKLGDSDAAYNFLSKADKLQPNSSRIKAGLGSALVRKENPFEALAMFDLALQLGSSDASMALDRGLAYDLLGNFERAQQDYALAASYENSDELVRRRAISLSLSGKARDADWMLLPLLQNADAPSWRARAMMLAARGDAKAASKIALGFLPEADARRLDSYYRNMGQLTAAQKAAALHFGHFPLGSNIGADSDAVKSLASAPAAPTSASGSRLIPAGEPLGSKQVAAPVVEALPVGRVTAPTPTPIATRPPQPDPLPTVQTEIPAVAAASPAPSSPLTTASAKAAVEASENSAAIPVAVAALPTPEAARSAANPSAMTETAIPTAEPAAQLVQGELPAVGPAVGPMAPESPGSFTSAAPAKAEASTAAANPDIAESQIGELLQPVDVGASVAAAKPMGPMPDGSVVEIAIGEQAPVEIAAVPDAARVEAAVAKSVQPAAAKPFDLDAVMREIDAGNGQKVAPAPASKEPPVRASTPDPKATAASRFWVQLATGVDLAGLGYDYKRMTKMAPELFAGEQAWTAAWGNRLRRLLIGPFSDLAAAKKWEGDFRKAGGDGFVWQSAKGEQVDRLLKGK